MSLSSVKRYLRIAQRGASLAPRKKGGGRPPKTDQSTERNYSGRTTSRSVRRHRLRKASIPRERITGKTLSDSTVKRLLKRLGFSRKNGLWGPRSQTNG